MAYKITSRTVRFSGNTHTKEVHDLINEQAQCRIDEIFEAGHAVGFTPDSLAQAHAEGFNNGHYCIDGSIR